MDIDCSPATVFHGVGPIVIVDAVAKNIVFADNSDLHIFTSRRVCPFRKKKSLFQAPETRVTFSFLSNVLAKSLGFVR